MRVTISGKVKTAMKFSIFLSLLMYFTMIFVSLWKNSGQIISGNKKIVPITQEGYRNVDQYISYTTERLELRPKLKSPPLRSDFGPVINDVFFNYPITVTKCKANYEVFIAVISAPGHFDERKLIRQTWLRHLNIPHGFAFILGMPANMTQQRKIKKESARYKDIIQVDMIDNFRNLTVKDVALFNWVKDNCPSVPFILKCDDDVFVNARNLATLVETLPRNKLTIYGAQNADGIVIRDVNGILGKWSMSKEIWPWSTYPAYVSGGSILISRMAIGPLLAAAQVTPYFEMEDVYVSGLIAEKAGVTTRQNKWSQAMFVVTDEVFDTCLLSRSVSLLTDTTFQMEAAYQLVEEFYSEKTQCLVGSKDPHGKNITYVAEPFILNFELASIDHVVVHLDRQ